MAHYREETYQRLRSTNPQAARQYCGRARSAAAKRGEAPPAWLPSDLPAATVRSTRPGATPSELDFTARRAGLVDEHATLRAPGRILIFACDGAVRMLEWHNGAQVVAEFRSAAEAHAAVAACSIPWRAAKRAKGGAVSRVKFPTGSAA